MTASTPLWAKGLPLDEAIHRFTVGEDPQLDLALLPFDVQGSAAHARMLGEVGLLSATDSGALIAALAELKPVTERRELSISAAQEDGHTALEHALIARVGEAGKRIHLGRSRNDQVLLALRLLLRSRLLGLTAQVRALASALLDFARTHEAVPLPGYTHLRRAMPSSLGQWGVGYVEGLIEELEAADGLWRRLDRCPLGAAAGFGVPLPLNRERVAQLLGFSRVQRSPVDAMNSRGRHEQAMLDWTVSLAGTLEKLCWDLSLYSTEEFGFVRLPDAFTTGSSIMPQKRNPDVLELARGRCRELRGIADWHRQIVSGLPGSYHRDFQLHKRPLLAGMDAAAATLDVLTRLVPVLQVNTARCAAAMSDELYAAHQAYVLVASGQTFRDAYRQIGEAVMAGRFVPDRAALSATHTGGLGALGLDSAASELKAVESWIDERRKQLDAVDARVFAS
ncbi:MAG: argininosuccinate lyase [Rhodanobacteraceae bacterium]|nr:argininosuccinate lyase [Rhodanobacteraceae bacterium]